MIPDLIVQIQDDVRKLTQHLIEYASPEKTEIHGLHGAVQEV